MNIKKSLLFVACAFLVSTVAFANPLPSLEPENTTKKVTTEIKSILQNLDLDYSKIENQTIKVKFMVNTENEIIVLSTGESELDKTLKSALNYKEIDAEGLKAYSVYVVPVTFKK